MKMVYLEELTEAQKEQVLNTYIAIRAEEEQRCEESFKCDFTDLENISLLEIDNDGYIHVLI